MAAWLSAALVCPFMMWLVHWGPSLGAICLVLGAPDGPGTRPHLLTGLLAVFAAPLEGRISSGSRVPSRPLTESPIVSLQMGHLGSRDETCSFQVTWKILEG